MPACTLCCPLPLAPVALGARRHTVCPAQVPQVFFNQEHIGNAGSCTVFSQCGQLKQRLLALAGTPHDGLPTPEASLTKVDSQVAFSSQPTTAQISRLRSYGFATMLNLAHPDEPGSVSTESALATHVGLQYVACPPAVPARVATSHVEVDLIPNITCTSGSSHVPSMPASCVSGRRTMQRQAG